MKPKKTPLSDVRQALSGKQITAIQICGGDDGPKGAWPWQLSQQG